jgi:sporadic carbohydrate cluster 2OG-Fe(II) oxygenase
MFLSENDQKLGNEFINNGYIVRPVVNTYSLSSIYDIFFKHIESHTGIYIEDRLDWLNNTHKHIHVDELNDFRMQIITGINSDPMFRQHYFNLVCPYLEAIVGNELAMQLRVNLSIQMPNDDSSLLPVHADTWSGDSPFEVVVWVPLVDCYKTKTMFILPPPKTADLNKNFSKLAGKSSENLFASIEKEVEWLEIKKGEILIFNQALPHGNRINHESETRWSMNCRFKGVFTPYSDKKIGEFFEPITLRPMSKIGMEYRHPYVK